MMRPWIEFMKESNRLYKKKLFKVEKENDLHAYVWAFSIGDAISFVCPQMSANYSEKRGTGVAWPSSENVIKASDRYFFEEVK